jgi:phosphatidyl-myo-inositol alpha-mannosyltransferase
MPRGESPGPPEPDPPRRQRVVRSRRVRIALVTEFYYPHLGGVTEHIQNLAEQLESRGHSVVVITSRMGDGRGDATYVRRIGRSIVILSNGSFARLTIGARLRLEIEGILREEQVDLVHVHGALAPTLGLIAPTAAHRLGIPVVATFHSWFRRSFAYALARGPLQQRLDRIAAKIAVSEPVVVAHSRYFRADWEIIPNGVRVDVFRPCMDRPPKASGAGPRLLFLGRLDPRNGLDTLLSAMPRILGRYPRTRLVVAGDGPLRTYYRRLARGFDGAVEFVGQIYDERSEQYASADLYLCPTDKASFGITLLEAMACGTPIIASDITGFRELTNHGPESLLVPARDPEAWSEATIRLIADPGRRSEMSAAGVRKAAMYSWPRVVERVLDVYARVLR